MVIVKCPNLGCEVVIVVLLTIHHRPRDLQSLSLRILVLQ